MIWLSIIQLFHLFTEEDSHKLESLEALLKRLEQGLARLEEENRRLKGQSKSEEDGKSSGNLTEELEKQKLILVAQVEKLESQLEKVTEASILDKQAAKIAQNQLWKVRFNSDLLTLIAFNMNIQCDMITLKILNYYILGFKLKAIKKGYFRDFISPLFSFLFNNAGVSI